MKSLRRSFQFIPANNPGMLMNADILGADAVIFDLEDAVALGEKDAARELLKEAFHTFDYSAMESVVRINPLDSPYGEADIESLRGAPADAVLIPKADVQSLKKTLAVLDRIQFSRSVILLVETARGLEEVSTMLALDERIDGALLGGEDLTSDLGVPRTRAGAEINYARQRLVTACRAARVTCIDTPWTDSDDLDGLRQDTGYARSIGFDAKSSINPRHLPVIHEAFAPSAEEISHAFRVMEAKELAEKEGRGVFSLDGKMVDAPVIARAERILNQAEALGLTGRGESHG